MAGALRPDGSLRLRDDEALDEPLCCGMGCVKKGICHIKALPNEICRLLVGRILPIPLYPASFMHFKSPDN